MTAPTDPCRTAIDRALDRVEADEGVRILYACESGSRAWGFPSMDSDYDVRFVYLKPRSWYLSVDLEHRRDVIDPPMEGHLDLSGWDLRKALALFRKSNPPLLEWLGSPIVYREQPLLVKALRDLAEQYYSPRSCLYHYLHMAQGNYRASLRGEKVRHKKYFYVLRPLLAILWIEKELGPVPTPFETLVDGVIASPDLRRVIADLLAEKRASQESDLGPPIPELHQFIERELDRAGKKTQAPPNSHTPWDPLNAFFLHALDLLWPED